MNREQLRAYVGITGHSLGQVEKDYFQNIVLSSISRDKAGALVFKGGTALQKMGYVKRFSEDLDFTAVHDIDLEEILRSCVGTIGRYGYRATYDRISQAKSSASARFKIESPLFERGGVHCTIALDISYREKLSKPCSVKEYSPVYPDVLPYIFPTMDPSEILSEKVRALMTRNRPRDMYDAVMLLERGILLDPVSIERKLEQYGKGFDKDELLERCGALSKRWESELRPLIGSVPDHGTMLQVLKKAAEKM